MQRHMLLAAAFVAAHGAPSNITCETTFYGAKDNCPPGGDIAYPQIHQVAGGVGTWADPITFAGTKRAIKPGSRIYVPGLRKYFIMEDDCEECDQQWDERKKWHVDLWMGTADVVPGSGLIACENQMTMAHTTVTLDPESTYPVDTTPLFNISRTENNGCIEPAAPCHDVGNQCGNECEVPTSGTCQQWAAKLYLNMTRFTELNPKIDCNNVIKAGTSVCMGGTCGD